MFWSDWRPTSFIACRQHHAESLADPKTKVQPDWHRGYNDPHDLQLSIIKYQFLFPALTYRRTLGHSFLMVFTVFVVVGPA